MLVVSEVYQNYQTGVVSSQMTSVGRGVCRGTVCESPLHGYSMYTAVSTQTYHPFKGTQA
jgi:hypothetical protein